jgi:hypothetical protein
LDVWDAVCTGHATVRALRGGIASTEMHAVVVNPGGVVVECGNRMQGRLRRIDSHGWRWSGSAICIGCVVIKSGSSASQYFDIQECSGKNGVKMIKLGCHGKTRLETECFRREGKAFQKPKRSYLSVFEAFWEAGESIMSAKLGKV